MAIPLSMPNSDDIDDSHRLDLLLEQLLITLRQVLIHRRRVAAAAAVPRTPPPPHVRHRHEGVERTRTEEEEERTSEGIQETRVVPTEEEEEEEDVVEEEVTTTTTTMPSVQFPLPDLVLDSSSTSGKESTRTVRTCHGDHRMQCYHHHHHRLHSGAPTSWVDDGGQLIRLAGQLLHQVRSAAKEP